MAIKYALQISCILNGIKQRFLLDTIQPIRVSTTSSLSSHPIALGDNVSDHMYRDQATISISGQYSLNSGTNLNLGVGRSRLAIFQSVFETIKNKGIICELLEISKDEASSNRFLKRTNMVLTDISWSEKINSLNFEFTFTQIITSDAATNASSYYSSVNENLGVFDSADEYLPSYNVAYMNNFVNSIINYSAITSKVIREIFNVNSQAQAIFNKIKLLGKKGLMSLGISSSDASTVTKLFSNYELNNCDKLFSDGFITQINIDKIRFKFEKENSDKIQNRTIIDACNYILKIYNKINKLSQNVTCYQLSSAGQQTSVTLINNIYYQFEFKRNNTNNSYYLSIRNTNSENKEYSISSVLCSSAPLSYSECSALNCLFKSGNYYTYLLKVKNSNVSNLLNYFVIVSKFSPEIFCSELNAIITGE